MNIAKNLFDLTEEQIETSKMMYNGKIIKCLVAPYHTFTQLEKVIEYTESTYLYPEKELPIQHLKNFVSMIVNSKFDEIQIITTNQNIILDMVDSSVRVLTEDGNIVPCPIKTFMANIHDIRYSLLENEAHQITKENKEKGKELINALLTEMKSSKTITKEKRKELELRINMIGEDIISNILRNHLDDIKVI